MRRLVSVFAGIAGIAAVFVLTIGPAQAQNPNQITICHATGNPEPGTPITEIHYVVNHPARTADAGGHAGVGHQNGLDIIPPFWWPDAQPEGPPNTLFPGQNWPEGQPIFDNGCNQVEEP